MQLSPVVLSIATLATTAVARADAPAGLYASSRVMVGYGGFDYAGSTSEPTPGSFAEYDPETTSGAMIGIGGMLGWPVGRTLYAGLAVSLDPLIAPTGTIRPKEAASMPKEASPAAVMNGTLGFGLAYTPDGPLTIEGHAMLGGGGGSGLAGGFGLQVHGTISYVVYETAAYQFAPAARVMLSPLGFDPIRGGSVMFAGISFGFEMRAR